jgi:RNA polymerase sigma-70 factor (ECF subfamily)
MAFVELPWQFWAPILEQSANQRVWMRLASFDSDRMVADEHALVRRAQEGDRKAFTVLVKKYWDRLYRWMYHLTHNQHAAEDLAQEAFLKALAGLDSFRAGTNFRAWLFRIAHNNFVNQWREDGRTRQPFPEHLPALDKEPIEQAMSQEELRLLARTVGRLPPDYRAAFLLRVEEDLSFRQIAVILDITEETARWRVFKARQKLMDVLTPHLDREKS